MLIMLLLVGQKVVKFLLLFCRCYCKYISRVIYDNLIDRKNKITINVVNNLNKKQNKELSIIVYNHHIYKLFINESFVFIFKMWFLTTFFTFFPYLLFSFFCISPIDIKTYSHIHIHYDTYFYGR